MAESMLEATTQYQSGQAKAASSPRFVKFCGHHLSYAQCDDVLIN